MEGIFVKGQAARVHDQPAHAGTALRRPRAAPVLDAWCAEVNVGDVSPAVVIHAGSCGDRDKKGFSLPAGGMRTSPFRRVNHSSGKRMAADVVNRGRVYCVSGRRVTNN